MTEQTPKDAAGHTESSRDSLVGAGWLCKRPGNYLKLAPHDGRDFSWLSPETLWRSRNDVIAEYVDDPTDGLRAAWVRRLTRKAPAEGRDLVLDRHADLDSFRFVFFGDPGEGDASQYALVPLLTTHERDAEFAFISSDVIYPAGGVNEYPEKFCRPYRDFPAPVYAVPGNHNWYDGLHGFAVHFCGADPFEKPPRLGGGVLRGALRKLLWREPEEVDPAAVERCRELRPNPRQRLNQPAPYFVLKTGPVEMVGIDQGIRGTLDPEQGDWLRRVSRRSGKPKILVLGKPIYADGEYHPRPIKGGGTVDGIVRDPLNNYMATVVGDKHNYQRYPVKLPDGRVIQHIVSGGGGAFTHATHKIPKVDLPGVTEEGFRCYPRRGDSLSYYSMLYDRRFGLGRGLFYVPPDEAAAIMARRLGIEATREGDRVVQVSERSRRAVRRVFPLPGQFRGPLHRIFSEFFDPNRPPLFKNYLRVEVSLHSLSISCVGVTGCAEHEQDPPIENRVEIPLRARQPG